MATPYDKCPFDRYQNGMVKEPGPLHEPINEQPLQGSFIIEKVPSLIAPPHKYQMGMDREPGLLHEPVCNQSPLDSSETEPVLPVVIPPYKCRKRMDRPLGSLHEPLWEQPPFGSSLLLQTAPEPIDFGSSKYENSRQTDNVYKPGLNQQLIVSSQSQQATPAIAVSSCQNEKDRHPGPLHEPVWYRLPFMPSLLQRIPSPLDTALSSSQKVVEEQASGSSQPQQTPVDMRHGSCQMRREKWLGPLHEPLWDHLPLGSSLLLQAPPEAIQFDNSHNGLEELNDPLYAPAQSEQSVTVPHSSCKWSPAWYRLPLGSSCLERASSLGILPGKGQEIGGRHLGPLHQPLWE